MNVPVASGKKRASLSQGLETLLSGHILEGRLRGGEQLPTESALMLEHGVSRTVVREAMSRLQAAGMVETRHGIGTFVRGSALSLGAFIDPATISIINDSLAIMEFRISLEVEAAGLAAQRRSLDQLAGLRALLDQIGQPAVSVNDRAALDFQFHLSIAQATGNHYIANTLLNLGEVIIPRSRLDSARLFHAEPLHYEQRMQSEHEQIYQAIFNQDVEWARATMRLHLRDSREYLHQARQELMS
ncbi:FadR/GntR family transcriptional regulator [Pseudomonas fluorescens]|uniref:FadR family transcriptional regulator n=1 Tax=Pseudomonas fluorescens TaxID=294 RepID=A0A944DHJ9_PSEFL|nr:FadR/GntR family transcriptional regulator [Pseudomonas fluorescens]MBT2297409.1 FadR family transcriptional regulator [Pseudomonas fluorescens]MBT2305607.1 FadR family transcriptional regulator [Pseudomonas fluorescens]MBT2314370.1 FadR family transcriptional regulator [Pseudomonas fluorescens]MBT2319138.1 FadR family transcriptional regulator [Pseudomonas fluorescens]MBT2328589.1 FadR family transcriptional regulator [Pseudomonas fluorescens]